MHTHMHANFPVQPVPGAFPLGALAIKEAPAAWGCSQLCPLLIILDLEHLRPQGLEGLRCPLTSDSHQSPRSCFQFHCLHCQLPHFRSCIVSTLGQRVIHFPTFLTPSGELSAVVTRITDSHVSSGFTRTTGK